MTSSILESFHQLTELRHGALSIFQKVNLRHTLQHPAVQLLINKTPHARGHILDASESAGALALLAQGQASAIEVRQQSYAAYRCAEASCAAKDIAVTQEALWQGVSQADVVYMIPATDKGNQRVQADLIGVFQNLKPGGEAFLVMHKDQGAKRYETYAKSLFGNLEVLAKDKGWRLLKAVKEREQDISVQAVAFQVKVRGKTLELEAWPGVYAAGKLDPGSEQLIDTLPFETFAGKKVLDMGCGYGILSLLAAQAGAEVTALDDDLLAVMSTAANAERLGLSIKTLHSDVNSSLNDERFDVILMNPPFHVAKQVLLAVPQAFLAAAHAHLEAQGELYLVANRALAYEAQLSWARLSEVEGGERFKVLKAEKIHQA